MNKDMLREIIGWTLSLALVHGLVEGSLGLQLLLGGAIATSLSLAYKVQINRQILDNTNLELQRMFEQTTRLEAEVAGLRHGQNDHPAC